MNRKGRRTQSAKDRRAVRGIAKAAGLTEPTASEKDPGYLALQIRALSGSVETLTKTFNENFSAVQKGLGMNDVNQQVLMRVTRDLTEAITRTRRLCIDGNVDLDRSDFRPLKLHSEGTLDLHAYYEEYRQVAQTAGPEHADLAVIIWSQGNTPEEAVDRARLENTRKAATGEPAEDPDYEVEFYRANHVEDHHEQVAAGAQADG